MERACKGENRIESAPRLCVRPARGNADGYLHCGRLPLERVRTASDSATSYTRDASEYHRPVTGSLFGYAILFVGLTINSSVAGQTTSESTETSIRAVVSTIAGSRHPKFPTYADMNVDIDGPTNAAVIHPEGITIDSNGAIYIAETTNIRQITTTGFVRNIAGPPNNALGCRDRIPDCRMERDGIGRNARFDAIHGLVVDAIGNILVADSATIRKVTQGGMVTTVAGQAPRSLDLRDIPTSSRDGVGTLARFADIRGVAIDVTGNLYVTEGLTGKIRKVSPAGMVTTLAGGYEDSNKNVRVRRDGIGNIARFLYPSGIAVTRDGDIYVIDALDKECSVRRVTPSGMVTTLISTSCSEDPRHPYIRDGIGQTAHFGSLNGILLDSAGNVFVADFDAIRRVTSSGAVVTIVGSVDSGWTDGLGPEARLAINPGRFQQPIALSPDGSIYVAESDHGAVRRITISD
jgi:serine/threonine protein kinase, bacterial